MIKQLDQLLPPSDVSKMDTDEANHDHDEVEDGNEDEDGDRNEDEDEDEDDDLQFVGEVAGRKLRNSAGSADGLALPASKQQMLHSEPVAAAR